MLVMDEKDLIDLGLTAKGDRVKLQAFCNRINKKPSKDREQKIAKIKEILGQGKGNRAKKHPVSDTAKQENDGGLKGKTAKKNSQATLKFEFGWKNWIPGRGFVQQKKDNGGGTRSYNVPRHATLDDCQEIVVNLFFPNGKSPVGPVEEMNIAMGNFSGEFIIFMQDGGKPLEFTAEKYKRITGFAVPRIYLLTRKQDQESEEDHSEDNFLTPTFEKKAASLPTTLSLDENDGLIGTSKERQEYFEDLEKALKASLEADKEKEKVKEERKENLDVEVRMAKEQAERLERLRQSRELRCPLEPSGNNPRVRVCVRHNILGVVVTRAFDPNGTISGIYDWVGSLSPTPEHFRLTMVPCSTLYPEDQIVTVKNTIINMTVAEEPIPLSTDDNDVHFLDGRGFEGARDDTLPDVEEDLIQLSPLPDNQLFSPEVEPVYNSPPVQLLQGEGNTIQSLENKRMKHMCGLLPGRIVLIDRLDVVKELLALYKDDRTLCTKLSLSFVDETALGDGVLREVFSTF